ncbi:MAG: hypothetical protein KBT06_10615 [Prevotellaceae bacterium]|nr:hypothetical protein [Candidatus Colivivens equi]
MVTEKKRYADVDDDSQPTMASEPVANYAPSTASNRIVLNIPEGIDAEPLREKVNAYYETLLQECVVEQEFKKNLDNWLFCTGMYSGPNLCWDNEPFRRIESMGQIVLPMIDRARNNYPDYTRRHLGWLKRKLEL